MVLKYYYDLMSQPCRAVYIFLKLNNIPFTSCPVALRKAEQLKEEYEKINRFKTVPAIDHDGFKLAESVAIFRYLSREFRDVVQPNWYPTDSKKQARVEEYMSWQHQNIRANGSNYFIAKFIEPRKTGRPANELELAKLADKLEASLNDIESMFLKDGSKFLCGDEITVADLMATCEIQQPFAAGYDLYKGRPIFKRWMDRVKQATQPVYDEAHFFNYRVAKMPKT